MKILKAVTNQIRFYILKGGAYIRGDLRSEVFYRMTSLQAGTEWLQFDTLRQMGVRHELHRVRPPIEFAPYRVRPYLMPCSPPHFSSSTPSSRVRPLIE